MAKSRKVGFTKIPNDVLDALIKYRLPGEERQCLDFIIRKTLGWQKTSDNLSNSQFHKATGLKKPNICRALDRLQLKKIIIVSQNDNKNGKRYRFNLKYKTWEPFVKKAAPKVYSQKDKERYHFDQRKTGKALVKILPTKDIFKKKKEKANATPESKKDSGLGLLSSQKMVGGKIKQIRFQDKTRNPAKKLKTPEEQKRQLAKYLHDQGEAIPENLREFI